MEICVSVLSVKLHKIMNYFINDRQLSPKNLVFVIEYLNHFMKMYFSIIFTYKYAHID